MNKEQKTNIPGIVKVGNGILLNKDNRSLAAYKARKNKDKQIDDLEIEIKEIRLLLQALLEKE